MRFDGDRAIERVNKSLACFSFSANFDELLICRINAAKGVRAFSRVNTSKSCLSIVHEMMMIIRMMMMMMGTSFDQTRFQSTNKRPFLVCQLARVAYGCNGASLHRSLDDYTNPWHTDRQSSIVIQLVSVTFNNVNEVSYSFFLDYWQSSEVTL